MDMTISERLSRALYDKSMSMRELACLTDIPKSAIQRYISGDTEKIPADRLNKMADVLGVSLGYLMGCTETTDHLHAALDPVFGPDTPAAQKLRELGRTLAPAESDLISIYRGLNEKGQDMLLNTAVSYAANPELKKDGASSEETA